MVTKVYCCVGIAGAGKTRFGVGLIEDRIRAGLRWNQIAFCSFSRAASSEAAGRVAELTGESLIRLQQSGWYKTLHSAAMKCIGIDSRMLIDYESKSGREFFNNVFGCVPGGEPGTFSDQLTKALDHWNYFRSTLGRSPGFDDPEDDGPYEWTETSDGHTICLPGSSKNPVFFEKNGRQTPERCVGECGAVVQVSQEVAASTEQFDEVKVGHNGQKTQTNPHSDTQNPICLSMSISTPALTGTHSDVLKPGLYPYSSVNPYSGARCAAQTSIPLTYCTPIAKHTALHKPATRGVKRDSMGADVHRIENQVLYRNLIHKYEQAKILHGKLDFTDILLRFTGITFDDDFEIRQSTPSGTIPEELEVVIVDEYQDCSRLLDAVAVRLSEAAGELHLLGDPYQAIYGFSGSCAKLMLQREDQAIRDGRRTLLNCTRRNPPEVLEWGEAVLEEDSEYRSRQPTSDTASGTVGLMEWVDFLLSLNGLVGRDAMILARSWWNLAAVKKRLDEIGIPWRSCSEQQGSRWDCPVKIAYTLVMRELLAGLRISEQDWRRVTNELNQKVDGRELFTRGTKTKWAKLECNGEPVRTLDELESWGATPAFAEWVRGGGWRRDMPLLLDQAITKYGIQQVRKPSIRIGTIHSVKGLEARLVFCLAASTEKCLTADWNEELALKYVAITRTSRHYRLVVDPLDVARGRPLFWAAPKGERTFLKGLPDEDEGGEGIFGGGEGGGQDSGPVHHEGEELDEWESLRRQIPRRDLRGERNVGHDSVVRGAVPDDRVQSPGGGTDSDSEVQDAAGQEEWWSL